MNFCNHCGSTVDLQIPEGNHLPRHVCGDCGVIHYQNPKMVAADGGGSASVYYLLTDNILSPCPEWVLNVSSPVHLSPIHSHSHGIGVQF
jgi:ribosomal protein S27AE